MKAEEIKAAVDAGKKVHWSNKSYQVIKGKDDYMIKGPTGHAIGLTWEDGKTLNGKEEDFFLAEAVDLTTVPQKVADAIEDVFNSMRVRTKKVEVIRNDEPESFDVAVVYGDGKDDEFSFHVDPSGNLVLSDFTFSKNMGKAGDSQSNIAKKIKDHFSSLKENNKPTYMKHVKLFEEFIGEGHQYDAVILEPGKDRAHYKKIAADLTKQGIKAGTSAGKSNIILVDRLKGKEAADLLKDQGIEVVRFSGDGGDWIPDLNESYVDMIKNNWDEISYSWTTGGRKVPKTINDYDAEDILNDLDSSFAKMSEPDRKKAISQFKQDFKKVSSMNEGRIALNHVYANAPVRNKVLEILRNGRVTEQDFMDAVSKSGAPTKWISRNSHFFKVEEEDGVKYYSLSKTGHVIMSAINESEVLDIYEEFGLEENLVVDPLDLTRDFFYVSINGKVYGYQAKPGGNIEDVATTFKKMLKYSAGKALAWLKKNTELAMGAGGTGPLRESEETFIQTVKKEMDWNKPSVSIIHKDSDFAKYLKMLGVQDGWKEAYQYKGLPGSSVASKLKSLAAKYAQGQKVEVKRGTEKSAQSQFHDYFIIFR